MDRDAVSGRGLGAGIGTGAQPVRAEGEDQVLDLAEIRRPDHVGIEAVGVFVAGQRHRLGAQARDRLGTDVERRRRR